MTDEREPGWIGDLSQFDEPVPPPAVCARDVHTFVARMQHSLAGVVTLLESDSAAACEAVQLLHREIACLDSLKHLIDPTPDILPPSQV